jgi:hypothetical protein
MRFLLLLTAFALAEASYNADNNSPSYQGLNRAHSHGKNNGGRSSGHGGKPDNDNGTKSYGNTKPSGYGPSNDHGYGGKPSYGDSKPSYGDSKPSYGDSKPSYGGSKPSYGGSKPDSANKSYGGAKPTSSAKPTGYDSKPSNGGDVDSFVDTDEDTLEYCEEEDTSVYPEASYEAPVDDNDDNDVYPAEESKPEGDTAPATASRGNCDTLGKMVCSGTGFNTCDYSHEQADIAAGIEGQVLRYVYRDCAPGTACRPFNGAILCDWPQH